MAEQLCINEVGLRDGLQSQSQLIACADKLRLAQAIVEAGVRSIEATSFVSPKAVPQMADADELFARLPLAGEVNYSALVPNRRGLERAIKAGVHEVAVVLSSTETMNQRNINMNLGEAIAVSADTLAAARDAGLRAKAYVAVAFVCPFEGPVDEDHVLSLVEQMFFAGAAEVVIADTIGAAAPRAVTRMLTRAIANFQVNRLAVHFHDTRGFALANAWAALEVGIRRFDSSLGGLGGCPFAPGAAGNLATEDLVLMAEQCGFETGIDVPRLRIAIALAASLTGCQLGGGTSGWLRSEDARQAVIKSAS